MVIKQFEVYLARLNPVIGSEIQKTKPCMIISPTDINQYLNTVLIIPLTSSKRSYPTRVNCVFDNKSGQVAIDQMRAVDKSRLVKKLGAFKEDTFINEVLSILQDLFSL